MMVIRTEKTLKHSNFEVTGLSGLWSSFKASSLAVFLPSFPKLDGNISHITLKLQKINALCYLMFPTESNLLHYSLSFFCAMQLEDRILP